MAEQLYGSLAVWPRRPYSVPDAATARGRMPERARRDLHKIPVGDHFWPARGRNAGGLGGPDPRVVGPPPRNLRGCRGAGASATGVARNHFSTQRRGTTAPRPNRRERAALPGTVRRPRAPRRPLPVGFRTGLQTPVLVRPRFRPRGPAVSEICAEATEVVPPRLPPPDNARRSRTVHRAIHSERDEGEDACSLKMISTHASPRLHRRLLLPIPRSWPPSTSATGLR